MNEYIVAEKPECYVDADGFEVCRVEKTVKTTIREALDDTPYTPPKRKTTTATTSTVIKKSISNTQAKSIFTDGFWLVIIWGLIGGFVYAPLLATDYGSPFANWGMAFLGFLVFTILVSIIASIACIITIVVVLLLALVIATIKNGTIALVVACVIIGICITLNILFLPSLEIALLDLLGLDVTTGYSRFIFYLYIILRGVYGVIIGIGLIGLGVSN